MVQQIELIDIPNNINLKKLYIIYQVIIEFLITKYKIAPENSGDFYGQLFLSMCMMMLHGC